MEKYKARNLFLEEYFRLAQQQCFGASSEGQPAQGDMFNEVEAELDSVPESTEATSTRTKKKPRRKKLSSDLPHETIVHDIEDKNCGCCGHGLHHMGDERSEKLEFISAQVPELGAIVI